MLQNNNRCPLLEASRGYVPCVLHQVWVASKHLNPLFILARLRQPSQPKHTYTHFNIFFPLFKNVLYRKCMPYKIYDIYLSYNLRLSAEKDYLRFKYFKVGVIRCKCNSNHHYGKELERYRQTPPCLTKYISFSQKKKVCSNSRICLPFNLKYDIQVKTMNVLTLWHN